MLARWVRRLPTPRGNHLRRRSYIVNVSRILTFLALFTSVACASSRSTPVRTVQQVVRSTARPPITVTIAPELTYLGHRHDSAMDGKAVYDQYIFSEIKDGQLGRTFIVHFEHVVPGIEFSFDYPRHTMVRLGRNEYLRQSWPVENWSLFQSESMTKLLRQHSVKAPSRWLVNRYVRAIGRDKRAEIILFYLEPATELPAAVADLAPGGRLRELWEEIQEDLARRADSVFTVTD